MKILLFGEFSGFMNCLKDGLLQLGHEVFLASNGDSYKNYSSDFRWDANKNHKYGKLTQIFEVGNIWWHKSLLKGFDIVLLIDPHNVSKWRILNAPIYKYLIRNNGKVYLSGSGDTYHIFNYWYKSETKYHSYYEGYLLDAPQSAFVTNKYNLKEWEEELFSLIDGYIPIWYEYAEPYRNYPRLKRTIRIPINVDKFEYRPNLISNGKIVFYHGVSRACKGTRYIKPAFERMQKEYGDVAEFVCNERLPFDEYMKVMRRTNVIVDDANSFSIAMNGLFALAQGRLVMGGAEPIANNELGIEGVNPVFNINPDVDQICEVIKNIIDQKDNVEALGLKGRKFVELYHDYKDVARQYVELWEGDLK